MKYPWPDPKGSKGEEMIDPALPEGDAKKDDNDDTGRDGGPFVIFYLSCSAESASAVTLNLASRLIPQLTK